MTTHDPRLPGIQHRIEAAVRCARALLGHLEAVEQQLAGHPCPGLAHLFRAAARTAIAKTELELFLRRCFERKGCTCKG